MKIVAMKTRLWLAVALGVAAGLVAGGLFLYVEFQNNNQGEYYDPASGAVDVPYALGSFIVPFMVAALGVFAAAFMIIGMIRRRR